MSRSCCWTRAYAAPLSPLVSPNGPQNAGPTLRPSGVFQLNVRVPADLLKVVVGTPISLPVGAESAIVRASDKVMLSLRTKDRREARARYTIAHSAFLSHFQALRCGVSPPARDAVVGVDAKPGPSPAPPAGTHLTHKQIVALAGDVYREYFDRHEEAYDLDGIARADALHERSVNAWMAGDADDTPISRDDAEFLAALSEPLGLRCWRGSVAATSFYPVGKSR